MFQATQEISVIVKLFHDLVEFIAKVWILLT